MKEQENLKSKTGRPPFFCRKYIVNRPLQFEIILYGLSLNTIVIGFLYITVNHALHFLANSRSTGVSPCAGDGFYIALAEFQSYVNWMFLGGYVFSFIAILMGSTILSNRIAGPIYRMTRIIQKIDTADGTVPKELKSRRGDHFQELFSAVEKLLSRL